jgi:hypothetical protein
MNASGHFAITLSKRNRRQLFHSALAQIHSATKRLTRLRVAGAEDLKTVSEKKHKDIAVSSTERAFSAVQAKKTRRTAIVTSEAVSRR